MGAGAAAAATVTLPGDHAYPESITSGADGTLYIGSAGSGGIMRAKSGATTAEAWIKPGTAGSHSIFGVFADTKAGMLWACSNDLGAMGVKIDGTDTGSALKGFDLKSGASKVSAAFPGDHNFCNDIAVAPNGDAYVTNTSHPQIMRLKKGSAVLELWLEDQRFDPDKKGFGLDGIALGRDGSLYVNCVGYGTIFRVALKDGKPGEVTQLEASQKLTLPDGLRSAPDGSFLMVEGSGSLDRLTIEGKKVIVTTLQSGLDSPTGVTEVKDTAWVSLGQLKYMFGKGGGSPTLPFTATSVAIPKS